MGRLCGKAWAGSLPVNDWHVSPINGDLSPLKHVSIFVGTREMLYPDDMMLYEKLRGNSDVNLYVGHGLNHVYPDYPILEGRMAIRQIAEIMKR